MASASLVKRPLSRAHPHLCLIAENSLCFGHCLHSEASNERHEPDVACRGLDIAELIDLCLPPDDRVCRKRRWFIQPMGLNRCRLSVEATIDP